MAKVITTGIDVSAGTFTARVAGEGEVVVHLGRMSESNRAYAPFHGIKQRVCDAGALGFNKELNRYATNREKFDAMKAVADHLNSGAETWELEGVGRTSLLATAIATVKGRDVSDIRTLLKALTPSEKAMLAQQAQVKAEIDRLQASTGNQEKADELLAQFS